MIYFRLWIFSHRTRSVHSLRQHQLSAVLKLYDLDLLHGGHCDKVTHTGPSLHGSMSIQFEAEDREDDQGHISVELHLGFVGFFFKFMLNESIIKEHLLNEIPL